MESPHLTLQLALLAVPGLPREELVTLFAQATALQSAILVQLVSTPALPPEDPNRLLPAKEAARRLGISVRQLYAKAHEIPGYTKDLGGVRFHAGRLAAYIATTMIRG